MSEDIRDSLASISWTGKKGNPDLLVGVPIGATFTIDSNVVNAVAIVFKQDDQNVTELAAVAIIIARRIDGDVTVASVAGLLNNVAEMFEQAAG